MDKKTPKFIKHYTSIEYLHKILKDNYLLLGDPQKWSDKNDRAALQAFCNLKGNGIKAKSICFAEGEETMHNWIEHAKNGCCISFTDEILKKTKGPHFLSNFVKYKPASKITSLYLKKQKIEDIPFIKRRPYECEKEYRVIWFGTSKEPAKIHFNKNLIKYITLSPKMSEAKRKKLQTELENKYGISVKLSRLIKDPEWISKFENLNKGK